MGRLAADPTRRQMLPDFIFVRDPGYMIFRVGADSTPAAIAGDFAGFRAVPTGMDTLPLFFVTLNTCLVKLRLRSPNFNDLWIQLVNESLAPRG
jgi:hypothetical protein